MMLSSSEDGGTESSHDVIFSYEDCHKECVRPSVIDFEAGVEEVRIPGYFFGTDGKTIHHTLFKIRSGSAFIKFYADDAPKGRVGGPLFTDSGHLIGINVDAANSKDPYIEKHDHIGRRIDMCMPRVLFNDAGFWDHFIITAAAAAVVYPTDPWEQLDAGFKRDGYI
jgi:hypothetical protein